MLRGVVVLTKEEIEIIKRVIDKENPLYNRLGVISGQEVKLFLNEVELEYILDTIVEHKALRKKLLATLTGWRT